MVLTALQGTHVCLQQRRLPGHCSNPDNCNAGVYQAADDPPTTPPPPPAPAEAMLPARALVPGRLGNNDCHRCQDDNAQGSWLAAWSMQGWWRGVVILTACKIFTALVPHPTSPLPLDTPTDTPSQHNHNAFRLVAPSPGSYIAHHLKAPNMLAHSVFSLDHLITQPISQPINQPVPTLTAISYASGR